MSAKEHYDALLGNFYSWMLGDFDQQVISQRNFLNSVGCYDGEGKIAIDLGAGSGIQSIALAKNHFKVIAVDFCDNLLRELAAQPEASSIECKNENIVGFLETFDKPVDLIVCMGDTITHLQDKSEVNHLIRSSRKILKPNGRLIISYRDLSSELAGTQRFIPVRSDQSRIMTCFLEYFPEIVKVHDIIHERTPDGWRQHVSWYLKLRISKDSLVMMIEASRLKVSHLEIKNGMTFIVAEPC